MLRTVPATKAIGQQTEVRITYALRTRARNTHMLRLPPTHSLTSAPGHLLTARTQTEYINRERETMTHLPPRSLARTHLNIDHEHLLHDMPQTEQAPLEAAAGRVAKAKHRCNVNLFRKVHSFHQSQPGNVCRLTCKSTHTSHEMHGLAYHATIGRPQPQQQQSTTVAASGKK